MDNPDETVQVFPETCADCGAGLADGADAGVTVRVTEYMLYKKQCRCGCVTAATPPAGVADAPVSYGPNLQAFVAYLLVCQHVPVHRAAMLIADLTGARPSTGFVHGILRRCATRDRLTIRGYISTAAKHRVDIMAALRDAMTHNPWTPPIPAPT